jgi:hypothetical protein
MNYITNQNILDNGNINGWTPNEDTFVGTIYFTHPTNKSVLYATPHWDVDGEVPFGVLNDEGDYDSNFPSLLLVGSLEEQYQQYVESIKEITNTL